MRDLKAHIDHESAPMLLLSIVAFISVSGSRQVLHLLWELACVRIEMDAVSDSMMNLFC